MADAKEVRIKVSSYDHALLDGTVRKLVEISKATGAKVRGPIPLPTRKEIFTVLRSPHVDKSSREQFERNTHKRLLILTGMTPATRDSLRRTVMPTGVKILVKV